ncbi:MAG: hypothetical protein OHK93_006726 [Ramalina farinacea]|uniref:H/ACA ribonucleoprotein complex non-core subunit NAF1 n=1 Tax=Ramalina farinacea TaxID=258253 RepID=A0AA43TQD2_9LECA|nr:hypothetical protein [Ramalina farinacea]
MEAHNDAAGQANPIAFGAGGMSIPGLGTGSDTQQTTNAEQNGHQANQNDAATPKSQASAQSSITLGAQDGFPTPGSESNRDGPSGIEQVAEYETTQAVDAKTPELQASKPEQDPAPDRQNVSERLHMKEEAEDGSEPESSGSQAERGDLTTSAAPGVGEDSPLLVEEKLAADLLSQQESNGEGTAKASGGITSAGKSQDIRAANDDGALQSVQVKSGIENADVNDQIGAHGMTTVKSDVGPNTTSSTMSNGANRPANTAQVVEEGAKADRVDGEAEFEVDSEAYESSNSDSSDITSSSEDSDEDDFQLLGPEEAARRLMEDGGSDDEGGGRAGNSSGLIRTANEKIDDFVPKPDIVVTENDKNVLLGKVKNIVENSILIEAETKWDYQVLELGSVLCLNDKTVIGAVRETLGRVQQPYYSVLFSNAQSIPESGISIDTEIYYLEAHSKYTFTKNLRAIKGSDASNIHDEETGRDEMEFSDDEAEAEYRKTVKIQRQSRNEGRPIPSDGFSRGPRGSRGRGRGPRQRGGHFNHSNGIPATPEYASSVTSATLNYDDGSEPTPNGLPDGDELYTPLVRPANLHEMMLKREAPPETSPSSSFGPEPGYPIGNRGRGHQNVHRLGGRGRGSFQSTPVSTNFHAPPQQAGNNQGYGIPSQPAYNQQSPNLQDPPHYPSQQSAPQTPFYPPMGNNIHHSMPPQQSPQDGHRHSSTNPGYQAEAWYGGYRAPSQSFQTATHHAGPPHFPQPQGTPIYGQQQQQQQQQGYPLFSPPQQNHFPPSIPAGAHVNPAFFAQQQQQQQQGHPQSQSLWQHQAPPPHTNGYANNRGR